MAGRGPADGVADYDHQTRIQRLINNRQNGRRRGRGGGGQRSPNPGNNGNRQDNRQRGNAAQLHEKYKALARDAQLSGDRVQTEFYLQFADHYFRVLNEGRARFEEQRRQRGEFSADEEEYQDEGVAAQDQDQDDREEGEAQFASEPRDRNRDRGNGTDRDDRRRERPRFQPRELRAEEEEPVEERISLDVLPPAISAGGNGSIEPGEEGEGVDELPRAPRRRMRRPRPESDDEIAPAA
jgi:hypothetical protein